LIVETDHLKNSSCSDEWEDNPSSTVKNTSSSKKVSFSTENPAVRLYVPDENEHDRRSFKRDFDTISETDPEEFFDTTKDESIVACSRYLCLTQIIPFCNGVSMKLGVLYFLLELIDRYQIGYLHAGFYLGISYICQVSIASLCRFSPKTYALLGSFFGCIGFSLVFLSQKLDEVAFFSAWDELTLFIAGGIVANGNEIMPALQLLIKDQYPGLLRAIGDHLQRQHYMEGSGGLIGFLLGGSLLEFGGIATISTFGAFFAIAQAFFLCMFLLLDLCRENSRNSWDNTYSGRRRSCRSIFSIKAAIGRRRWIKSDLTSIKTKLARRPRTYECKNFPIIVNFVFVVKSIIMTLIFVVSTLKIGKSFEQKRSVIGWILAGASAASSLSTFLLFVKEKGTLSTFLTHRTGKPDLYYLAGFGITGSAFLTAVPVFSCYVVGLILLSASNSIVSILLKEVQAEYDMKSGFFGILLRRAFVITFIITAPYLYGVLPQLTQITAFWIALLFMFGVVVIVELLEDCKCREAKLRSGSSSIVRKHNDPLRPQVEQGMVRNITHGERMMLAELVRGPEI